ncbi:zwei Ig domain protein zig-2-like isoform X2 [Babylonia areolata]|uniref:zwei Ig domain protein zig-2-like isoform X2 n=1 Tax=Babylonia areolata TaxID=304850 RepID=UPI003FD47E44
MMVQLSPCVLLFLLFSLPLLASAFLMSGRSRISKRISRRQEGGGGSGHNPLARFSHRLIFKNHFHTVTVAHKHQSTYLECEVGGRPVPTIHWLKDGVRISQGTFESHEDDSAVYEDLANDPSQTELRLSSTTSRLYLDCPTRRHEGEYTCVAETPYTRRTQSTILKVERRGYSPDEDCLTKTARRGEPARIYMWTVFRLELEAVTVQFFCRASGFPEPTITWYDDDNNTLPDSSDQFSIAANGDLIIRDISWSENMGGYRCQAENAFGSHSVDSFLYPTTLEDANNLPV